MSFYVYVLLIFFPLSAVIYFFVVRLKDSRQPVSPAPRADATSGASFNPNLSLGQRRRLDRADELESREVYPAAIEIYETVLEQDATNKRALHGLARCYLGLSEYEQAQDLFMKLLERDREYRDFAAVLDYAEALSLGDRKRDAVELLQGLVGVSPRINHRLALAHYAMTVGDLGLAREQLQRALAEYNQSRQSERDRNQRWAVRARQMLTELNASYN